MDSTLIVSFFAVGFSGIALLIIVSRFVSSHRPYVSVTGARFRAEDDHEVSLELELKNHGEIPAKDMKVLIEVVHGTESISAWLVGDLIPGLPTRNWLRDDWSADTNIVRRPTDFEGLEWSTEIRFKGSTHLKATVEYKRSNVVPKWDRFRHRTVQSFFVTEEWDLKILPSWPTVVS